MSEGAEMEWEIDSARPVHDISDDDIDRAPSCVGAAVEEKEKSSDFSALKKGKLADMLKSQHLKSSDAERVALAHQRGLGGDP